MEINRTMKKPEGENFTVHTITFYSGKMEYCHWSKGLVMYIKKDGKDIKLEPHEIEQLVKSLPRTMGGSY